MSLLLISLGCGGARNVQDYPGITVVTLKLEVNFGGCGVALEKLLYYRYGLLVSTWFSSCD